MELDHQSFLEGAFWELMLLSFFIGAPALIAVLWEKHSKHRERHQIQKLRDQAAREGLIERRSTNVRVIPASEQKVRDDNIFKAVEEYRHDAH